MTLFNELHAQNHKLIESANVLQYLLQERTLCDTDTACELLYSFLDSMDKHLGTVDSLYTGLLTDKSPEANNAARKFMSGEQELKRIISQYVKKWCKKKSKQLSIADHESFVRDTQDLFELVQLRIQDETEHLYPMVRQSQSGADKAA